MGFREGIGIFFLPGHGLFSALWERNRRVTQKLIYEDWRRLTVPACSSLCIRVRERARARVYKALFVPGGVLLTARALAFDGFILRFCGLSFVGMRMVNLGFRSRLYGFN